VQEVGPGAAPERLGDHHVAPGKRDARPDAAIGGDLRVRRGRHGQEEGGRRRLVQHVHEERLPRVLQPARESASGRSGAAGVNRPPDAMTSGRTRVNNFRTAQCRDAFRVTP
jgi:hypothetical protein